MNQLTCKVNNSIAGFREVKVIFKHKNYLLLLLYWH